jgi:hypothetical protein
VKPPKKRPRQEKHDIPESDEDDHGSDGDFDGNVSEKYRDPSAYLNNFRGYHSDSDAGDEKYSDDNEDESEEDGSDEDGDDDEKDAQPAPKRFVIPKLKKPTNEFDFSTLPAINNSGLKYLPKMLYFPAGDVCLVKPQNKVDGEALSVLILLPNGGFKCLSIPFEAVEETDTE